MLNYPRKFYKKRNKDQTLLTAKVSTSLMWKGYKKLMQKCNLAWAIFSTSFHKKFIFFPPTLVRSGRGQYAQKNPLMINKKVNLRMNRTNILGKI